MPHRSPVVVVVVVTLIGINIEGRRVARPGDNGELRLLWFGGIF
jgi:hypothetical protein